MHHVALSLSKQAFSEANIFSHLCFWILNLIDTCKTHFIYKIYLFRLNLAMGVYEISTGIGMIVGPLLGGLLYTVGGFALPFYVVGAMMLFGAFINYFLIGLLYIFLIYYLNL